MDAKFIVIIRPKRVNVCFFCLTCLSYKGMHRVDVERYIFFGY